MISLIRKRGSEIDMQMPNLQKAKIRNKETVRILTDAYKVEESLKTIGRNLTYFIKTYGCQMNEHDSENIKAILEEMSFTEIDDMEKADLILLNTCAIRENAHNKVFGMIGRIKHLKEEKPHVIAGICGCMAQEESVVEDIKKKYKHIDIVFGTHNIHGLPSLLEKVIEEKERQIEVYSKEGDVIENIPVKRDSKYKAWINIMYGCDKFCTYCIVPYTRGKQRSRQHSFIIEEVKDLVKQGYKEVTLLGQNVNAYGKDLEGEYRMENLLEEVAGTGIERVRFVTSHPWDFTDAMIDTIAAHANIMPYIHLPLQAGSNTVLKRMGRRYTKEDYLTLFHKLKERIPNAAITTDIIVGFPGETKEDFEETLEVVRTCKFDGAFTFLFSPREGTPAAKMADDIPLDEKNQRLYALNEYINQYSNEANQKYLGKVVPVLLENVSEKDKTMLSGYSDTMKLVNVKAPIDALGEIINVKITDVKTWSMDGEMTNN
ncbi:MAG: tRNA (N6-isopentenyl adenosine(37)-C2)-methylthiotransferase MiaB [Bacilli bacterium]|nr:tRNA (N6-isopentenyl adenosine(37)-C2)-methylthiotransferase MiaB [Bacilli bacterium]